MFLTDIFVLNTTIDGIVPDITLSEGYRDDLRITRHPVEQGAAITDHAFKEQPEVELRIGFSDVGKGVGYSTLMYAQLLALQESRKLINVSTGKRLYSNCLIESILTETTEGFTFSSIIAVRIRKILIARLAVVAVPDQAKQTQPATSAPTQPNGDQQTAPTTPPVKSAMQTFFGGIASLFK